MNEDNHRLTEHHLREALRHLERACEGDLRKTNEIALEQVSNTVATVLSELERGE